MWAALVSVATTEVHYRLQQLHSAPWLAVESSKETLRTLHDTLNHIHLFTWQGFGRGVRRPIIKLLLRTHPYTVKARGGVSKEPLASFFNCWFRPGALCWRLTGLFKCLPISWNTNKLACQPGGEDKAWRGKRRPFFSLCDRNCVGTSTCHPPHRSHLPTMTTEEEVEDTRKEKRRAQG